jgi:hypothetical protein
MLCGFTLAARPGEELVVKETMPVNPFTAAMTIVDVPDVLGWIVMLVGLARIVKSGALLNVAPRRFSGITVPAFTMVTQELSLLVFVQPVW